MIFKPSQQGKFVINPLRRPPIPPIPVKRCKFLKHHLSSEEPFKGKNFELLKKL